MSAAAMTLQQHSDMTARALERVIVDATEALERLRDGKRPSAFGTTGSVLGQGPTDVETWSTRLNVILDLGNALGLTEDEAVAALKDGARR